MGAFIILKPKKHVLNISYIFLPFFFFHLEHSVNKPFAKSDDGFVIQEITILMFGLHQFGFKKSQHPF